MLHLPGLSRPYMPGLHADVPHVPNVSVLSLQVLHSSLYLQVHVHVFFARKPSGFIQARVVWYVTLCGTLAGSW